MCRLFYEGAEARRANFVEKVKGLLKDAMVDGIDYRDDLKVLAPFITSVIKCIKLPCALANVGYFIILSNVTLVKGRICPFILDVNPLSGNASRCSLLYYFTLSNAR
jgi:hypothetical protein